MKLPILMVAVTGYALLIGAPGALAFTIVSPSSNSATGVNLTDPDQKTDALADQYQSGNSNSSNTMHFAGGSLQFSSSQSRDDTAPSANDRFLDTPASRTVPSASW